MKQMLPAIIAVLFVSIVEASYVVTPLEPLAGHEYSEVSGISDWGVIGSSIANPGQFQTATATGWQGTQVYDRGIHLNPSNYTLGFKMNESGAVVGQFRTDNSQFALREQRGYALDASGHRILDGFGAPTMMSFARGINNAGDVVGYVHDHWGRTTLYLWRPDGSAVELGRLSTNFGLTANDLNDDLYYVGEEEGKPYIRRLVEEPHYFTLGSPRGEATFLNETTQVAGRIRDQAVRWEVDRSATMIPFLMGHVRAYPTGMNDTGIVVGNSYPTLDSSEDILPWIFDGTSVMNINHLVPEGIEIISVHGINNRGEIAAMTAGGGVLLSPVPEPALVGVPIFALYLLRRVR